MATADSPLKGAEVFVFDIFGTVIDWYGNITVALAAAAPAGATDGKYVPCRFHEYALWRLKGTR